MKDIYIKESEDIGIFNVIIGDIALELISKACGNKSSLGALKILPSCAIPLILERDILPRFSISLI